MKQLGESLVDIVTLNDQEIATKVRLQKTIYLLHSYGYLEELVDPEFEYHYYGPYSAKLARAADELEATKALKTHIRQGYHSEPYTVYQSDRDAPTVLGQEMAERIRIALRLLREESSLVLEVAATIHFLRNHKSNRDAVGEVKRLKPKKASAHRIRRAERMLQNLEKSI